MDPIKKVIKVRQLLNKLIAIIKAEEVLLLQLLDDLDFSVNEHTGRRNHHQPASYRLCVIFLPTRNILEQMKVNGAYFLEVSTIRQSTTSCIH